MDPMLLRMALLLFAAAVAFLFGLFVIRRLRKNLLDEAEFVNNAPLPTNGLPVHAYHAVIQQLKQQKYELSAQHMSERRKAKASDSLSSTILSNLSCGVLFLNTNGLVRQANPAARQLLGFASPVGLHMSDLLRTATLRAVSDGLSFESSVEQALAPALTGKATIRGLLVNYASRDGKNQIIEVNASPVLAEDASLMGTSLVLNDKTDIEQIRHDQEMHRENSAELVFGVRSSLSTIAENARQIASIADTQLARRLAESISGEAAQLDRTIASFLGDARVANAGS
jgi:PAS domain-containing protein